MERIKVYHDRRANTLDVWFGDPDVEYTSAQAAPDVILMRDDRGRVIGFEKLNFTDAAPGEVHVTFESVST
jgi:hypothetical protein